MEASVLSQSGSSAAAMQDPRARFLRLQSDERLVSLTRRGNDAAFETLIDRYRARLLAFCRHMVGSTEDAEDILQEVFVSAYRAMLADDRELNVRPWLYRIARNRSLNHLRRPRPTGVDSMDIYEGGAAVATADRVHDKLDLEDLVDDVKRLPETQRTALMLREMGDLSYDQIAETMDTTIPSVKSLLVRARVSLAEAAESRRLSCEEVRLELGAVAEGLQKITPPAKRHVKDCERCRAFKKELTTTNHKLAMLAPIGAFAAFKALVALKLFGGAASSVAGGSGVAAAGTAGTGAAAGSAAAGGAAAATVAGASTGVAAAGIGAVAAKVGTGLVAAAIVTGGVAQVARHDVSTAKLDQQPKIAQVTPALADPAVSGGAPVAQGEAGPTDTAGATDAAGATTATSGPASAAAPTNPAATAPTTHPTTSKPVVEKDTTVVTETTRPTGTVPPTSGQETPELPGGSSGPAESAPTPPAANTPAPGQTGSMVSPGPSGGSGGPTQ